MKKVYMVVGVAPYYDGGNSPVSLHATKESAERAKAALVERQLAAPYYDRFEEVVIEEWEVEP